MKVIALFILFSSTAWSYPVFFKCEAGGRLSDQITPAEIDGRLNALVGALRPLSANARAEKINEYCEGGALCMREFEQLLQMAEVSGTITREIMNAELARIRSAASLAASQQGGIAPVGAGIFTSALQERQMREGLYTARECRVAMENFSPESFNNDGRCVLANFGHSPYMYPSGIRFSGTGTNSRNGPAQCNEITEMVRNAHAVDQDPYAAIAISLMENGTHISNLYLDPIGSVKTLGCKIEPGTRANHNLESYNTFHRITAGVKENPELISGIRDFMTVQGHTPSEGVSYLCNSPETSEEGDDVPPDDVDCSYGSSSRSCSAPIPGACCVRMPFSKDSASVADQGLTFASLKIYIEPPLEERIRGTDPADYPARRLQRFNGYSDAMGGAEAVSAWRSGVNYYRTPAYGYQAMDFMLNTLWSNPFVRNAVREAEAQFGRK